MENRSIILGQVISDNKFRGGPSGKHLNDSNLRVETDAADEEGKGAIEMEINCFLPHPGL